MSTAPRRSLAGAFAPAPRSAGLLEALPTRNLRSIDPDPASTDTRADAEADADTSAVQEQTAPTAADTTRTVQARTPHVRTLRTPQGRGEPAAATPVSPAASAPPASIADNTTATPNRAGVEEADEPAAKPENATISETEATTVAPGGPQYQVAGRGSADDVVRSVAVYLAPALLARLKHSAAEQQVTYADVLVQAASTHAHTLVGRFAPPRSPTGSGGGMPARSAPARGTGGIQTQLRLDGHQIAWLDLTVRQTGAPSRSALVAGLLDAALPAPSKRT